MLTFVTSNDAKVTEAEAALGREVEQVTYDYPERQADSVREVAIAGAQAAFRHLERPVLVDDTGLSVEALDGFPGPYAAYVEETLGIDTVAELAGDSPATFQTALACVVPDTVPTVDEVPTLAVEESEAYTVVSVLGELTGRIVSPRGAGGFGYDPIFEVDGQTLAERSLEEKTALSHRGRAFTRLREWLVQLPADPFEP